MRGLTVNRESKRVQALTAEPGDRQVTLRWSPPADEDGIAHYRYSRDNLRWWRKIPGGPDARTVTVNGLNGGQEYLFRVRARYQNHYGSTARATATPTGGGAAQVPEAPTHLTYTLEGSMITLSWWVPNMRGAALLRYETRTRVGTVGTWSHWRNAGKTPTWRYASHERNAQDFSITVYRQSGVKFSMLAENSAGRANACRTATLIEGPAQVGVSEPPGGDLPGNNSSTGRIVVGGDAVTGHRGDGDNDWFAVDLQGGVGYSFRLSKRGGGTASMTLTLYRYGTPIRTRATFSAEALEMDYTISTSGQYWLDVYGATIFDYTATITER